MTSTDLSQAFRMLDEALIEVDHVLYVELICRAADFADALETSSADEALRIWARIAMLDGDRAKTGDLVDHARTTVQAAGIDSPPTTAQEYDMYLATLPPAQRCLMQVRYLQRVVTSERGSPAGVKAAGSALELLAEYEQSHALTKKQKIMKLVFQDALQRNV